LFWWVSARAEKLGGPPAEPLPEPAGAPPRDPTSTDVRTDTRSLTEPGRPTPLMGLAPPAKVAGLADASPDFQVSLLRALVPLVPAAAIVSLLFAVICGSGYAATQSMYPFFVGPARELGVDPVGVGTIVSLSTAAGRTMSPVAAVVLTCSEMTGT